VSERWTLLLLGSALALSGCDNMANQPKRLPYEVPYGESANWPVKEPPNVVAHDAALKPPAPPPITQALLERGRQRFNIYCSPCHDRLGEGNGMIPQRGFPHPPSYMEPRLLQAPSQHFYDVITNGYGVMYSYSGRVARADRWAIVAYIRALQRSSTATLADVSPDQRKALR
jgi:mono/diheme cytochrome c family protein